MLLHRECEEDRSGPHPRLLPASQRASHSTTQGNARFRVHIRLLELTAGSAEGDSIDSGPRNEDQPCSGDREELGHRRGTVTHVKRLPLSRHRPWWMEGGSTLRGKQGGCCRQLVSQLRPVKKENRVAGSGVKVMSWSSNWPHCMNMSARSWSLVS